MTLQTAQPTRRDSGGLQNQAVGRGGVTGTILPQPSRSVNSRSNEVTKLLFAQATAAAERAEATAAWHRERAGRYLAWCDLPWCAAQYRAHIEAAAFQDAIAARHRAVQVSLQGVRHG